MADLAYEGTILACLRDPFPTMFCARFGSTEAPGVASCFQDCRARYRVCSAEDRSSSDGESLFDAFDLGDFSFLLSPVLTCFQVAWYSDDALIRRPEFLVQRLADGWRVCLFLHSQDFDADSFHLGDLTTELERLGALLGVRSFLFGYEELAGYACAAAHLFLGLVLCVFCFLRHRLRLLSFVAVGLSMFAGLAISDWVSRAIR